MFCDFALRTGWFGPPASLSASLGICPGQQGLVHRRADRSRCKMAVISLLFGMRHRTRSARSPARPGIGSPSYSGHRLCRVRSAMFPLLLLVFFLFYGLPQAFPRRSDEREVILDLLPTPFRTFCDCALDLCRRLPDRDLRRPAFSRSAARYLDAGRSLGLRRFALARYVTGPIMFRTVLPSLSNTFISLFKDTSIAFFIGVASSASPPTRSTPTSFGRSRAGPPPACSTS